MLVCGIDEAGRGPVIGPLVMAGVLIEAKQEFEFRALGIKDSKQLTKKRREELFKLIQETAKGFEIMIIEPDEIDRAVFSKTHNLNKLEAEKAALIINNLKPDKAIIDCPSINFEEYRKYLASMTLNPKLKIVAENKADINYPVVSAASILAKVTRDNEIKKIQKQIPTNIGSGYPADPETRKFLEGNFNNYNIFRKSWESWQRLRKKRNQKKIFEY